MSPKYFYRVHVQLDDDERTTLAFDFKEGPAAIRIAEQLYNSCDIIKVWVNIVTNEYDTTESPMWRS